MTDLKVEEQFPWSPPKRGIRSDTVLLCAAKGAFAKILSPYNDSSRRPSLFSLVLSSPYDALHAACSLIAFVSLFYPRHGLLGNVLRRPLRRPRHSFGLGQIRCCSSRYRRLPLLAPSPLFHRLGYSRLGYQPHDSQSRNPANALDSVSPLISISSLHTSATPARNLLLSTCVLWDASCSRLARCMLMSRLQHWYRPRFRRLLPDNRQFRAVQ